MANDATTSYDRTVVPQAVARLPVKRYSIIYADATDSALEVCRVLVPS